MEGVEGGGRESALLSININFVNEFTGGTSIATKNSLPREMWDINSILQTYNKRLTCLAIVITLLIFVLPPVNFIYSEISYKIS